MWQGTKVTFKSCYAFVGDPQVTRFGWLFSHLQDTKGLSAVV